MRRLRRKESKVIREMVRRIVAHLHPEKIILFGSHARGDATADSDVDLLIVMPVLGTKGDAQLEARKALRGIGVPVDVVVTSPEDFEWRRKVIGTIEYPAATEGRLVYVRS